MSNILKYQNPSSPLLVPRDTSNVDFNKFLMTLPDNQRLTPEEDYHTYHYWLLNGRPKNFRQAKRRGMYHYDKSDSAYHAQSVAFDENGVGWFMKPKHHPTVKYELDWFNNGLETLEGGIQRPLVGNDREEWEDFTKRYQLDTSGVDYRYVPIQKKGGRIHIKKKNRGKFTAAAKRAGMGVQEFAKHVLANKDKYSSTLVKRANFARNAKKFKHENGGILKAQEGAGNISFDKQRVVSYVPGDGFEGYGTTGPIKAVWNYFFNDEDVLSRIKRVEDTGKQSVETWNNTPYIKRAFLPKELKETGRLYSSLPQMKQHEDAKRLYLGYPMVYNTMADSEYTPTIGTALNAKYIKDMRGQRYFDKNILPRYMRWKTIQLDSENPKKGTIDYGKTALVTNMPYLDDATMSEGFDDKGHYISIYDTWDYNTGVHGKHGDNVGKYVGGKSFDIYDRYYLDDYFDIPEEARGNPFIMPSKIVAETVSNNKGNKKLVKPATQSFINK